MNQDSITRNRRQELEQKNSSTYFSFELAPHSHHIGYVSARNGSVEETDTFLFGATERPTEGFSRRKDAF